MLSNTYSKMHPLVLPASTQQLEFIEVGLITYVFLSFHVECGVLLHLFKRELRIGC
jgi:hypothetical protein